MQGRCECGQIIYECHGEVTDYSHCHCSQCRRLHGAAFASYAGVKRETFSYTQGESELTIYASSETTDRHFCKHCGSDLLVDYKPEADMLYLCMGTLQDNPKLPPGYHQFVRSMASWFEITDDLPQFQDWPDEP